MVKQTLACTIKIYHFFLLSLIVLFLFFSRSGRKDNLVDSELCFQMITVNGGHSSEMAELNIIQYLLIRIK